MIEKWLDIEGFVGYYQISSLGRVKSLGRFVNGKNGTMFIKERILKNKSDKDGYLGVVLSKNGKTTTCKVHRLVAQHFIGNPENKNQINYINGDKKDNSTLNLEWVNNLKNTNHHHNNGGTKKYGVHKSNNKWRARIKKDGKSICLGHYNHKEEAYQAFYNKYKELHGTKPW